MTVGNAAARYVDIFSPNVINLARQEYSYLQQIPMRQEVVNGRSKFIDRIGSLEMARRTSLLQAKDFKQTESDRIKLETFIENLDTIVTDNDIKRAMTDPTSIETANIAEAYARNFDKNFIAQLDADVTLEGGGTLTFTGDGGIEIAAGAASLTKAKLETVLKNFLENEIMQPSIQKYLLVSPQALIGLMDDDEIKNKDYITAEQRVAFLNGNVGMLDFYGFKVITSNQLPVTAGNVRSCYAFTNKAMIEGTTWGFKMQTVEQTEFQGNPTSIGADVCYGFVRSEGKHVQRILVQES